MATTREENFELSGEAISNKMQSESDPEESHNVSLVNLKFWILGGTHDRP
jgi:hypothetical protein